MKEWIRGLNTWTHRVSLAIAEIALVAMVLIVTMTVILRYCFNTGISWAEEVPLLLVSLFAFLACAMGVRDHTHMAVTVLYGRFKKGGQAQRSLDILTDVCVLLCGLFMLWYGGQRCLKMMALPGKLPMTGLRTWWQFLPIPLGGFLMTFDSILFLTGVLNPRDTLFTEPDKDYAAEVLHIDRAGNIISSKAEREAAERAGREDGGEA
jgi:TRAP-type C4-dicarboxylate transport system permease small subunit